MPIRIDHPEKRDMEQQGVFRWPVWTCEPSTFDWHYDAEEVCYILEGNVRVTTAEQDVSFGPGDFVTFPKGLDCTWSVSKAVRKHYAFR